MPEILDGMKPVGQYLPQEVFTPNLELVKQAMGAQQEKLDAAKGLLQKSALKLDEVNKLEGDNKKYQAKRSEYLARIAEIESNSGGNLLAAGDEMDKLFDDLRHDYGRNGMFTQMQNNYDAFAKDLADVKKRRKEGKVGDGAVSHVYRELKKYNSSGGIGYDKQNWRSWDAAPVSDYVDVDKLMNDALKQKESELERDGWDAKRDEYGVVQYWQKGQDIIDHDTLVGELKGVLSNAMGKTNELNFEYKHALETGAYKIKDRGLFLKNQAESIKLAKTHYDNLVKLTSEKDYQGLAEYLNKKVFKGTAQYDAKNKRTVAEAAIQAAKLFEQQYNNSSTAYKEVEAMSQDEYLDHQMHRAEWSDRFLGQKVEPYAALKSRKKDVERNHWSKDYVQQEAWKKARIRQKAKATKDLLDTYTPKPLESFDVFGHTRFDTEEGKMKSVNDLPRLQAGLDEEFNGLMGTFKNTIITEVGKEDYKKFLSNFKKMSGGRLPSPLELSNATFRYTKDGKTAIDIPLYNEDGTPVKNTFFGPKNKDKSKYKKQTILIDSKTIDPKLFDGIKSKASNIANRRQALIDRIDNASYTFINQHMQGTREELQAMAKIVANKQKALATGRTWWEYISGGGGQTTGYQKALSTELGLGNINQSPSGYLKSLVTTANNVTTKDKKAVQEKAYNTTVEKGEALMAYAKKHKLIGDGGVIPGFMATLSELKRVKANGKISKSKLDAFIGEIAKLEKVINKNTEKEFKKNPVTALKANPLLAKSMGIEDVTVLNDVDMKSELGKALSGKKEGALDKILEESAQVNQSRTTSSTFYKYSRVNEMAQNTLNKEINDNRGNYHTAQTRYITSDIPDVELKEKLTKMADAGKIDFSALISTFEEYGYVLGEATRASAGVNRDRTAINTAFNFQIKKTDGDGKNLGLYNIQIDFGEGFNHDVFDNMYMEAQLLQAATAKTVTEYGNTGGVSRRIDTDLLSGERMIYSIAGSSGSDEPVIAIKNQPAYFQGVYIDGDGGRGSIGTKEIIDTKSFATTMAMRNVVGRRLNQKGLWPIDDGNGTYKQQHKLTREGVMAGMAEFMGSHLQLESKDKAEYTQFLGSMTSYVNEYVRQKMLATNPNASVREVRFATMDQMAFLFDSVWENQQRVIRNANNLEMSAAGNNMGSMAAGAIGGIMGGDEE